MQLTSCSIETSVDRDVCGAKEVKIEQKQAGQRIGDVDLARVRVADTGAYN